jgi:hypothetical protein
VLSLKLEVDVGHFRLGRVRARWSSAGPCTLAKRACCKKFASASQLCHLTPHIEHTNNEHCMSSAPRNSGCAFIMMILSASLVLRRSDA